MPGIVDASILVDAPDGRARYLGSAVDQWSQRATGESLSARRASLLAICGCIGVTLGLAWKLPRSMMRFGGR